ncbi:Crp/Fnr family transcriptional regulator [Olleya sp. UBA1516]|jgi:CRP-like cAMP-binding protein|uniref:Crp/Fnr family transcriptional regulator n=1 Tax=Olleya sp. UBA1516 TaxID=1947013 RepID=UPI002600154F|nr:Crp/Fnr family transcriptional regulator [Olleya sp. UBA1516]|tara:strand:- start:795 stop:1385 length:591 start_codon:yes stop_codon:yes gene_type:complete
MVAEKPMYYNEIKSYITSFYPISEASFNLVYEIAHIKQVKSGTVLVNIGDVPNKIYMINKGVMRSYVRLENGKEVTKSIFVPRIILASFRALINQTPSECIYESLTDCEIYEVDYFKYKALCETNAEVLGFHAKFLEQLLCQHDAKHIELLTMNAKQRYLKLRKVIPNIDNLIPQYQIAKFLSITPVQLSRIRAKL